MPTETRIEHIGSAPFYLLVAKHSGRPPGLVAINGVLPRYTTKRAARDAGDRLARDTGADVRVICDESLQAALIRAWHAAP